MIDDLSVASDCHFTHPIHLIKSRCKIINLKLIPLAAAIDPHPLPKKGAAGFAPIILIDYHICRTVPDSIVAVLICWHYCPKRVGGISNFVVRISPRSLIPTAICIWSELSSIFLIYSAASEIYGYLDW